MARFEKYRKGADAGDNEFTGFVNYAVTKKSEGRYRLRRFLMVCGYVLFAAAYSAIFLVLTKAAVFIALLPVFIWILTYFTWMLVSIEYEYTIIGGVFRLTEVYGMRRCRELCSVRLGDMTMIAPYNGEYGAYADCDTVKKRIYGVSSMDAYNPDIYFGIYTDDSGYKCALFFEATGKTLKVIKYYNPGVIIAKTRY